MLLRYLACRQRYATKSLQIDGKPHIALVADTYIKRMLGLMYRESLGPNECMLFIYSHSAKHPIRMKNMLFSIDIIWLDANRKVVDIARNISPFNRLQNGLQYLPRLDAKYVIELRAGSVGDAWPKEIRF
jgi:uncharacterized membrane protein (UPF0127 family)